ncbi:hypothetical protein [Leptospira noguchii]|uniref:hypothetical protein n=1 Tax=Leptospira noguchii TaxID=28182 RepID=UPI001E33FC67|nr:hypothetical protein [Leptospira noguchii]
MHRFLWVALAGLGPRSVDESKSATANSCVATKPSRPRRKLSISLPMGRSMGVPVYHNSGLLRPSAPLKTLGERNEKSRNQIRRNRL